MGKISVKMPRPSIYPVPTLLLTCRDSNQTNIITISWAGILCSSPPIISISVQPQRHSYGLLKEYGKFTINIPSVDILLETDYCGNICGKDVNKQAECRFNLVELVESYPMAIKECKHHLLCEVIEVKEWGGTHTTFIAEVKHEYVDEDCYLGDNDYIYNAIKPIAYCRKNYYQLADAPIGYYGYSQRKDYGENGQR